MTTQNPTRLWRVAGALALAHVVLLFAGLVFEKTPFLGDSRSTIEADLVHSSMSTVLAGQYVEYLSFLAFLLTATLLARLLRGTTETSRWLSACAGASGVLFVAVTLGAFAGGLAALYDGHSGIPLDSLIPVSDLRIFAFYLSVGVLGVFTLTLAGAAHAARLLPRWLIGSGYAVGAFCVVSLPLEPVFDAINYGNMLWFVWLIALAVVALRGIPARAAGTARVPVAV